MSHEHKMELEHEVTMSIEYTFDIEPYNRGGWEEAPSGGCGRLEEVKVGGKVIPSELWAAIGLTAKAIENLETQAYESACEAEQDAREAAGDDRYHMLKDEGRI
jgi:hypothetical protein